MLTDRAEPLRRAGPAEVFGAFLKLGVTAFGGPLAHLGYFRDEFVVRRRWLDEQTFAQIVALCQMLPGPASSQVGMIVGIFRAGFLGGVAAWVGFTLPSAIALTAFALGISRLPPGVIEPWLHGLLIAAVAVVAFAVTSMAMTLCPDRTRRTIAIVSAIAILLAPVAGVMQVVLIVLGGLFGHRYLRSAENTPVASTHRMTSLHLDRRIGMLSAICFALVLAVCIGVHGGAPSPGVVFAKFFETGSLVFGGGHVVLPMLQARVLPYHWVDAQTFLAGYGAAQAVPGPLFTFAAFLGAAMWPGNAIGGAALCLGAIYLPSYLLLAAVLPFWNRLRDSVSAAAVLRGVNAVVVGILFAALYTPIWTSAIHSPRDVAVALGAFLLLAVWRIAPWRVVALTCLAAFATNALPG